MKKCLCLLVLLVTVFIFASCRSSLHTEPTHIAPTQPTFITDQGTTGPQLSIPEPPDTIYTRMETYLSKRYIHTSEALDYPIVISLYENHQYSISSSPFSSSFHGGFWQYDGDFLLLGEMDSGYYFQILEGALVFLADRSVKPGNALNIEDNAIFTELQPQPKTYEATAYYLPGDKPNEPMRLYLFESGFFCFVGPTKAVVGLNGHWSIDGDDLHLEATDLTGAQLHWYFHTESDGISYIAERSSVFPLDVPVSDGEKMLLLGGYMTPGTVSSFTCDPAMGGFSYSLFLYECGYFELTGHDLSVFGCWSKEGNLLTLYRSVNDTSLYYHFLITENGFLYLQELSRKIGVLVDGDCFSPFATASKGFLYTASPNHPADTYRLLIASTNTCEFWIPGANRSVFGSWEWEDGIFTLHLSWYTEDHRIVEFTLCFQEQGDSLVFLPEQSDNPPEGCQIPEDLTLALAKAQLP